MWQQQTLYFREHKRGFHLITSEVVRQLPQISHYRCGMLHLFMQHTSASLTLNENADPTVRQDMEAHFNHFVPENAPYYKHTYEGWDDMPAHIKSSLLGVNVTVPIVNGQLALGTWQGIYLGEHRNSGGERTVIAIMQGEMQGDLKQKELKQKELR